MITTTDRKTVESWIAGLVAIGLSRGWAIVVRDLHNSYEYPHYVSANFDIKEYARNYLRVGAEQVCEVYDLSHPLESQFEKGGEFVCTVSSFENL